MVNLYETDALLAQYLLFHYGRPEEILPRRVGPADALDFAVRVVRQCVTASEVKGPGRALDLGCAVGRSSFELARFCEEVLGIDYSTRFIGACQQLQRGAAVPYRRMDEGDLTTDCLAHPPAGVDRERVRFETGDACDLRDHLSDFDVVLMANLIDRLPNPRACLSRLPGLLKPGGQLVIASPFTWLEEYTPRENWLGGFERDGGRVGTFDTLVELLAGDFVLERSLDLPFLIREHARKFQWSVSRAGVWRRR